MSSRPILPPQSVITNGDMTTTLISLPTIVQNISMASYDISWSGSAPAGAITIQVSNTYQQNSDGTVRVAGNWTTLTLSSPTNVSGATGNGFVDVDATAGYAIRCVYTPVSGSGSLNVVLNGKVM